MILDCEIDTDILSFLAIGRDFVDVGSGKLKFWVNSEEVTFNVYKSIKQPNNLLVTTVTNVFYEEIASVGEISYVGGYSTTVLLNYGGTKFNNMMR